MKQSITVLTQKKRGPAPTGKGTLVGVRLQPSLLEKLDAFASSPEVSRPEAARRLIKLGLALQMPVVDLLDALELTGLDKDERIAKEVAVLESLINVHHQDDEPSE